MIDALHQDVPKAMRVGTHRSTSLEDTLARAQRVMPVMGITRIANVTGLDTIGIPVAMVCRPNSRSLSVSQGKGLSLQAAKASGVMESVEAWHAERITAPLKYATYEELRYTHNVIDVAELPQVDGSPYHQHLRLLWIEGYDVVDMEAAWVPYELAHLDLTLPLPVGSGCFPLSSNGLASGNHILEAMSHAACEVVERDSTSLWMLKGEAECRQTKVRLETIDDEASRALLDLFEGANVGVSVWDTTTDIGIPSFLCTITQRAQSPIHPVLSTSGMGCHPSRSVALQRALTEAAQSRLTYISGSRDDLSRKKYMTSRRAHTLRGFQAELDVPAYRRFDEMPTHESDTLNEDIAWELDRLRASGVRHVVVVDLSKPEFGIPVVRVVVSGLEGSDEAAGYTPGRRARDMLGRHQ